MYKFTERDVVAFRVFSEDDSIGSMKKLGDDFESWRQIPDIIKQIKEEGVVKRVDLIAKNPNNGEFANFSLRFPGS